MNNQCYDHDTVIGEWTASEDREVLYRDSQGRYYLHGEGSGYAVYGSGGWGELQRPCTRA